MHELSIALALVHQAEEILQREGGARVTLLTVDLGRLSGVDPEALRFSFPFAAAQTPVAEARLVIHEVPLRLRCEGCLTIWESEGLSSPCPACASSRVTWLEGGQEMFLRSVDID